MTQEGTEIPIKESSKGVTVRYEVDGEKTDVRLQDVSRLFSQLDQYRRQFSMNGMLFRVLDNVLTNEDGERRPAQALAREEENQLADATFLNAVNKKVLEDIGLGLQPIAGKTVMMSEGVVAHQGDMMINVADSQRFSIFLGAVQPDHIQAVGGLKEGLQTVSGALTEQIVNRYSLTVPQEEVMELFNGLNEIIGEYKRLGMDKDVTKLEDYYAHAKKGDLREHVYTERFNLLAIPGVGFGPGDWQKDSPPAKLRQRWDQAVAVVDLAKNNPNATELRETLAEHLRMCAEVALENLPQVTHLSKDDWETEKGIIEKAKQKIDTISSTN